MRLRQLNIQFKALSDKTRRKILEILKEGDLTAGEIAERFEISKPSITHHLNLLYQADLVDRERQGQYIYYTLNTSVLQEVMVWLMGFLNNNEEEVFDE
ncbi:MAG TPA: winged helix-turn-helix transcriptional regulator [Halanaerobiaceae bacterium]|mgnify:CR=1 FL=1|jgi:DNA-binding transcriptional ArsR family regulator|nr:autorepressor SdpR family transcription factor [Bacillota bacterium]HHU92186.1 winged helix-turn-helix transcriptional regulator [Halanaerobiaceae bacterium]HOA41532.1 autorepressor SdpR family transcription factor [Halanaerobiales bacterium]HPZ63581.1 autorepressor SdpR family transcription factor [Halanaerobiales bacterium]HQD04893.1 autorepressor SdpR family transcription factor [Halanaerobiales bacterium]